MPVWPGDDAGKRAARRSTGPGSRRCAPSFGTSSLTTFDRLVGPDGSHLAQVLPEVRDVLPELPGLQDDDSDCARFQLFDSFSRLLRNAARDGPIVLILDDLHAADEPSLLLLRFVSMDLADTGIVVLAVYREGELAATDPRIGLLAEVARVSSAERLDPPGLTVNEVARYIEIAASERPADGLAEAVHRETEGNPLFVGETRPAARR